MTANILLMATLGLAATGAGFLAAPHAAAWVDAALDDCPAGDAGASAHAFSGKHARAKAHAQAKAADPCEEASDASAEDEEECEREKAKRRAHARHEDRLSASVDVGVSVDA